MYAENFERHEPVRMDIMYSAGDELLTLTMSQEIEGLAEDMFAPLLGPDGFANGERTVEDVVTVEGELCEGCVVLKVPLPRDKGLAIGATLRRYFIEHLADDGTGGLAD